MELGSHYKLAKQALLAGKHVLLEKPMTSSVDESKELIEIAKSKNLVLMVDHTFLYTGAVQKMKELIDQKQLGNLQYPPQSNLTRRIHDLKCKFYQNNCGTTLSYRELVIMQVTVIMRLQSS